MTTTTPSPTECRKEKNAELKELREQFREVRIANASEHTLIKDVLNDLRLSIAMTNERINSTRTVAVVVWSLFIVALGGIGWVVNQAADVIQGVDQKLDHVSEQQHADAAKGWQIAERLEGGMKTNKEDIDTLEGLHRSRPTKKE
jgi:uncharacterized coiled-coil DUF342 family protein